MKFDRYEWKILQALQGNARLTLQELSDHIGLSNTPCWRRLQNLQNAKVIRRYSAIIDQEKVNLNNIIYVELQLERHNVKNIADFEQKLAALPEVLEFHATLGDWDYLLKVVVPDTASYDRFLQDILYQMPAVSHVKSTLIMRTVKNDTALPLNKYPGSLKE